MAYAHSFYRILFVNILYSFSAPHLARKAGIDADLIYPLYVEANLLPSSLLMYIFY